MITIITSLYRSESHLKKYSERLLVCASELLKNNVAFEVICIANDPTPNEEEYCNELQKEPWFKYLKVAREPIYATWNRGIESSKGNMYTFWNVDDIRFSDAVIEGIRLIESGAEVVYFPFIYKRYIKVFGIPFLVKRKTFIPALFEKEKFYTEMHSGPFFMVSQAAIKKTGGFDATFKIAGDFDWCSRAARADVKFERSNVIGGIFTNDGTTLSGSRSMLQQEENSRVYMKNM